MTAFIGRRTGLLRTVHACTGNAALCGKTVPSGASIARNASVTCGACVRELRKIFR